MIPSFTGYNNDVAGDVVIRLIGTYTPDEDCYIRDLSLKNQYPTNLPYLRSSGNQKVYGDLEFPTDTNGVVLTDRTTATKYRLKVDNGVLGIEAL